jgi:hypothetical protein
MLRVIFLIFLCVSVCANNRSKLRPYEPLPTITTYWDESGSRRYSLTDSHLEEGPIFKTYNKEFFEQHILPTGKIAFRNQNQLVSGTRLCTQIERFVTELQRKQKKFSDMVLLKDTDFNYRNFCGCIIVKFKQYPFVLKLFVENPKSFVHPFSKGFEPCCFFVMGGGIMRHLTGFTRIQNLEDIKQLVAQDPYWSQIIDTPRKWFWLPVKPRWFVVEGEHIGNKEHLVTKLPAVYGIIADEIKITKKVTLFNAEQSQRCMKFCQFTQYRIDPHICNFRIEKNTGKLVLIDTENFRALVGLKDRFAVDSYVDWYLHLTAKCAKDKFFRTKHDRHIAQAMKWEEYTS